MCGGMRPTLGLLATALREADPDGAGILTLATGAAMRVGLLELLQPELPLAERPVRLPPILLPALAGLPVHAEGCDVLAATAALPASMAAAVSRWAAAATRAGACCLVLRGGDPADRRLLAAALTTAIGGNAALAIAAETPRTGLGVLCRLAGLVPADEMELGPGERRRLPDLPGYDGVRLVLTGPDGHVDAATLPLTDLTSEPPTARERAALWQAALGTRVEGLDAQLLGPGRIAAIGRRVRLASADNEATAEAVRAAGTAELRGDLAPLAIPVADAVSDGALVLPPDLRDMLDLLLARCRQREVLGAGLGPAAHAGTGVRALLVGPPGTGKTLAGALARDPARHAALPRRPAGDHQQVDRRDREEPRRRCSARAEACRRRAAVRRGRLRCSARAPRCGDAARPLRQRPDQLPPAADREISPASRS